MLLSISSMVVSRIRIFMIDTVSNLCIVIRNDCLVYTRCTMNNSKYPIITTIVIMAVLWVLLRLDTGHEWTIQIIRIIVGSIGLLFLPGYWITQCFFTDSEIDILERIALSFAFSISVVPLLVFYLNLMGIKITAMMVYLCVLALISLSRGYIQRNLKQQPTPTTTPHLSS